MLQKRREPVFYYWFPLFVFIIYISFTSQKPWNWSTISRKLPWPRHHPAGSPAATAQRCAGAIPGITAGNVHHRLRDATGDRPLVSSPLGGILAHPITRTYTRVRNGKQYTYHQTDWVADVCAHQFHHEYERARLMRLPCRLVGHANQKMIHEVYLRLKASMIDNAAKLINEHLKL